MDKIAQIKLAETHGVLAALADNGMLKVACEEDFDFMTEKVAEALGDDYDMEGLISKTAGCEYLMDKIASEEFSLEEVVEVMEKEACAFADLGEFLMLKEAARKNNGGNKVKASPAPVYESYPNAKPLDQLRNPAPFEENGIDPLKAGQTHEAPKAPWKPQGPVEPTFMSRMKGHAAGAGSWAMDRAKGKDIAGALREAKDAYSIGNITRAKAVGTRAAKNIAGTAGVYAIPTAAALYGGKKLYDRFKN